MFPCRIFTLASSAAANQVSLGRGLRRLIDMFHTANELVDENDRRLDILAAGDDDELTEEYVFHLTCIIGYH